GPPRGGGRPGRASLRRQGPGARLRRGGHGMGGRDPVFDDPRTMSEVPDPPPEHLVEAMIAAVAAEYLDAEYELLTMTQRTTELTGVRGAGPLTIEFAYDDVTVLIRVTDGPGEGTRRIDGWITPVTDGTVRVVHGDAETT